MVSELHHLRVAVRQLLTLKFWCSTMNEMLEMLADSPRQLEPQPLQRSNCFIEICVHQMHLPLSGRKTPVRRLSEVLGMPAAAYRSATV